MKEKIITIFKNIINNKTIKKFFFLSLITLFLFVYYFVISNKKTTFKPNIINDNNVLFDTTVFGITDIKIDNIKINEPITWYIIDETEDAYLLLSKDIIQTLPYSNTDTPVDWQNSLLRAYLNMNFCKNSFTEYERNLIIQTEIDNSRKCKYGHSNGKNTYDFVFILSNEEIKKYLNKEKNIGILDKLFIYKDYWTRTVGYTQYDICYANLDNELNEYGTNANTLLMGVRPAMWVKKDKSIIINRIK